MSRGSQVDTTLVVRAKDEASRAIAAIGGALQNLRASQQDVAQGGADTASGLAKTVTALAGLDRAYVAVTRAQDKAAAATDRQNAKVDSNRAALAALQAQLEQARAAQERMNAANQKFVGPPTAQAQAQYRGVADEIRNLQAQLRTLQRSLSAQESGLNRSASDLAELGRAERLAAAVTTFAAQAADEHTAALEREAAAAARVAATRASISRTTDSRTGKSAAESAAVFQRAGLTPFERDLQESAARLRTQLDPLADIQRRLNTELGRLPAVARAGKFSIEELAGAEALLRRNADDAIKAIGRQRANGGKFAALGLQPHELQNLGFQVNDIVTQLASGTSLTQTLAQQGGQILQIFPRAGSAIVGAFSNPAVLAFAATLGVIIVGIKSAADQADRLRGAQGFLTSLGDGGRETAENLAAVTKELDRYGLSAEEALKVTRALFRDGFDAGQIEEFGTLAKNMADVLGIDVVQAANELGEAWNGNFDALDRLIQKSGSFTVEQRNQIRTLYEQGRASEATARAFGNLSSKMQEGADLARSDWTAAFRGLGNSWDHLVEQMGNTWWAKGALDAVNALARGLDFLSGSSDAARQSVANRITAAQQQARGQSPDPLAGFYAGTGIDPSGIAIAKPAAPDPGGTAQQQVNAQRLTREAQRQRALEGEITNQKQLQARLDAIRADENEKIGNTVTDQVRLQLVNQKVEAERVKLNKQLAERMKQQREEAERIARQTQFISPVDGRVTSGFGLRQAPKAGASRFHKGLDIAVPVGTPVRAPANGVVIETGVDSKLGKFVFIDHGNSVVTKFGHLSDNSQVTRGQVIRQGEVFARSGNTGNSTGPHLHFQTEVGGKPVDPRRGLFPKDGAGRFEVSLADAIADADKAAERLADQQDKFTAGLEHQIDARREDTRQLEVQAGLTGDALLAAQRQAAIEDAIAKARDDAAKLGIAPDDPGLKQLIERLGQAEGAYFDVAHAREQFENARAVVDRPVQDLTALRDQLQQQIEFLQDRGQMGQADQLQVQLDGVNAKLGEAIERARAFYAALGGDPKVMATLGVTKEQIDAIMLGLQATAEAGRQLRSVVGIAGQEIAETFRGSAMSAIEGFAQEVAGGANAFKSLGRAFLRFAADFLQRITAMILQQKLFLAISGLLGVGGGAGAVTAGGGTSLGAVAGVFAHSGGIIGGAGPVTKPVNPAWFANARRMHTGGIAGLRADEVPTILQKGEEVLTRSDVRHRFNGGASGGRSISQVLAIGEKQIAEAIRNASGEQVVLTHLRNNRETVRQILNGN